MTRQDGSAKAYKGLFIQPLTFLALLLAMLGSGPAALATDTIGLPLAFQSAPSVFERALPAGFQAAAEEVTERGDNGFDAPVLLAASVTIGAVAASPAPVVEQIDLAPRPLPRAFRARAPPLR